MADSFGVGIPAKLAHKHKYNNDFTTHFSTTSTQKRRAVLKLTAGNAGLIHLSRAAVVSSLQYEPRTWPSFAPCVKRFEQRLDLRALWVNCQRLDQCRYAGGLGAAACCQGQGWGNHDQRSLCNDPGGHQSQSTTWRQC